MRIGSPTTHPHPLRSALLQLWAPVPWMLEGAILLQLVLGKGLEAGIIAALLVFNAGLGFFQQSRAAATLAALKSRLALSASVRRDGQWATLPAADVVPGDVVKLSLGGVVPADVRLTTGEVPARPIDAHRRIGPDRSRPRRADLRGCLGAARGSRRRGHRHGGADQIRSQRGPNPRRPTL